MTVDEKMQWIRAVAFVIALISFGFFAGTSGALLRGTITGAEFSFLLGAPVAVFLTLWICRRHTAGAWLTFAAAGPAVLALAGAIAFRIDPVRRTLVVFDDRKGRHLGWANDRLYVDPVLGPALLEPLDVDRLLEKGRLDYSTAWLAVSLQRRAVEALSNEARGLALLLRALYLEANPPAWWNGDWSRRLAAQPSGTFRMGLLPQEVARERLRMACREAAALPWGRLQQVILAAGLHPGLLTGSEAETAMRALRERAQEDGASFDAVLSGRAALAATLAGYGKTPVGIRVEAADGSESSLTPAVERMAHHLIGTLGFAAIRGDGLRIVFAVERRTYERVELGYESAVATTRTETRWATQFDHFGVGRQRNTVTRQVPEQVEVPGAVSVAKRFSGKLRAEVLVLKVESTAGALMLEAPPWGFRYCSGSPRSACAPAPSGAARVLDATNPVVRQEYGLPSRAALLLRPWLWGLRTEIFGVGREGESVPPVAP